MQMERQICGNREHASQDKAGERAARKTPTEDTLREAKLAQPLEKKPQQTQNNKDRKVIQNSNSGLRCYFLPWDLQSKINICCSLEYRDWS